jgi:hypothetical protein
VHKNIVIKAFEKAKGDIPGRSSKTNISDYISEILLNDYHYQVSGKTLRNLYDKSKEIDTRSDISINSSHIIHLCKFLGYKDYDEFMKDNPEDYDSEEKNKLIGFFKRNKVALIISIVTIIIIYSINTFNKQRWMVWDNHRYVEVDFDAEKYTLSQLKLYNKDRIENFQKVNPDCETQYFNEGGSVNFWYGKNIKGELEYFTAIAKHPETGKTLKAITAYMVRTHICDTY